MCNFPLNAVGCFCDTNHCYYFNPRLYQVISNTISQWYLQRYIEPTAFHHCQRRVLSISNHYVPSLYNRSSTMMWTRNHCYIIIPALFCYHKDPTKTITTMVQGFSTDRIGCWSSQVDVSSVCTTRYVLSIIIKHRTQWDFIPMLVLYLLLVLIIYAYNFHHHFHGILEHHWRIHPSSFLLPYSWSWGATTRDFCCSPPPVATLTRGHCKDCPRGHWNWSSWLVGDGLDGEIIGYRAGEIHGGLLIWDIVW